MLNLRYTTGSFLNSRRSSGGFTAEYQAVYNSFTTKPSSSDSNLWNAMVKRMVDNGEWAKQKALYFTAIHTNTNGEALINWKNPGTFDLTIELNGGTMNFTAYEGFQSDDGAYLNTHYDPVVQGLSLNDAAIGVYLRTNVAATSTTDIGVQYTSSRKLKIASRFASDVAYGAINDNGWNTKATTDSRGFWVLNRLLSTTSNFYRNLINSSASVASNYVPNGEIYLLALNYNQGTVQENSTRQLSCAFISSGLDEEYNNEVTNMQWAINAPMIAKSKNVFDNYLIGKYQIVEDTYSGHNIANTGLSYDSNNNYLIISEWGANDSARILIKDRSFNLINTIDISSKIDQLQGVAYDNVNEIYYVWGIIKGEALADTNGIVKGFNSSGTEVFSHAVDSSFGSPKATLFYEDGHLWFGATAHFLYKVKLSDWSTVDTKAVYTEEGLWFNSDGSYWVSNAGHIYQYNASDSVITDILRVTPEIEGIMVTPDKRLYLNSDEWVHGGITDGNRVWVYDVGQYM